MLKVVNNAIYLTRGDTAILQLSIKQDDGSDYAIADTDNVLFTIKKSTKEKTVILQKSVMDGKIKINPEETSSLEYGTYFYDVQLRKGDGTVATVITPFPFILSEEVTF
jgi:uncharacterized membrane protein YkoI